MVYGIATVERLVSGLIVIAVFAAVILSAENQPEVASAYEVFICTGELAS